MYFHEVHTYLALGTVGPRHIRRVKGGLIASFQLSLIAFASLAQYGILFLNRGPHLDLFAFGMIGCIPSMERLL
jgi:hypothetical protein